MHLRALAAHSRRSRWIVQRLNTKLTSLLSQPRVAERFTKLGMIVTGSTPQEMDAHVRAEIEKWRRVVSATGAKAN